MDRHPARNRTGVPLLDLYVQYAAIRDQIGSAIERVIESQHFILGPEVESLEGKIAKYSRCQYAVGVSSGTDALLASLMAIDIKPGDEVITTPYTFFATVGSISRLGARPVFVDIDPLTYNMDPEKVESVVSPRSRAIIPVHLYGQMADMDSITEIARRKNLHVIEDAAQAIGAEQNGRRAGSVGHLGCLSFYPSKNLGAFGDAGMVTTNDGELAERVRLLRSHGSQPKYFHKLVGGNFRLDAIQAAVLRVKLKYLDQWTTARQNNAIRYRRLFRAMGLDSEDRELNLNGDKKMVLLPSEAKGIRHTYNQFVIRVSETKRDALIAHLKRDRIGAEIYYPVPLHRQECFNYLGYREGDFPESEAATRESLALPIYPELTEAMQGSVVQCISDFLKK
jgi:dTDP-4-amino-4,6-dideoxygalactose transaminase